MQTITDKNENFHYIANYLISKKVPLMIKTDYQNNKEKSFMVNITKKDRFFRANGKIISSQFAKALL
jgi:hypothetical protein